MIPEEENYEEAKKYFTRPDRIYNTKFSGNEANNYLFQYYKEYKNRPGAKQQAREKVLSVIK